MDVVPRATHPSSQWARACYRGLSSKATTSVPGLCGQLSLQPPDSFYKFQWFSFLQALIIKIITQIKKIRKNVPTSMLSRVTQNKVLVCQTRWDCCEHFYASIPIDLKSGCLGSKYHSFSCYNGSKAKPLWPLMDFDPWCFVYLFTTFSCTIRCYVEVHRSSVLLTCTLVPTTGEWASKHWRHESQRGQHHYSLRLLHCIFVHHLNPLAAWHNTVSQWRMSNFLSHSTGKLQWQGMIIKPSIIL